jgi:hypothetical protein
LSRHLEASGTAFAFGQRHLLLLRVTMLRITRVESQTNGPTIKLEGKLLAPWTDEVRVACQRAAHAAGRPRLDLSAVTFVDGEGAKLLAELIADGSELADCSHFVATLMHWEAKA